MTRILRRLKMKSFLYEERSSLLVNPNDYLPPKSTPLIKKLSIVTVTIPYKRKNLSRYTKLVVLLIVKTKTVQSVSNGNTLFLHGILVISFNVGKMVDGETVVKPISSLNRWRQICIILFQPLVR